MDDFGGLEFEAPSEGGSSAPEQLSDEAKQRFAAAAAAMQAIRREEKKSRKRDSRVARTIIQFLNDERYTHLFVLISRLVARDCPSIFILSILSLINEECESVVNDYLQEQGNAPEDLVPSGMKLTKNGDLDAQTNQRLIAWITRMQAVLAFEPSQILNRLVVEGGHIDGTVLQLATFVLEEFFRSSVGGDRDISFDQLQPLAGGILQAVFEPFVEHIQPPHIAEPDLDTDEDV